MILIMYKSLRFINGLINIYIVVNICKLIKRFTLIEFVIYLGGGKKVRRFCKIKNYWPIIFFPYIILVHNLNTYVRYL